MAGGWDPQGVGKKHDKIDDDIVIDKEAAHGWMGSSIMAEWAKMTRLTTTASSTTRQHMAGWDPQGAGKKHDNIDDDIVIDDEAAHGWMGSS